MCIYTRTVNNNIYTYTYIPIKNENTTVAKATVCPYVGPSLLEVFKLFPFSFLCGSQKVQFFFLVWICIKDCYATLWQNYLSFWISIYIFIIGFQFKLHIYTFKLTFLKQFLEEMTTLADAHISRKQGWMHVAHYVG
jgi:hypothetical protein